MPELSGLRHNWPHYLAILVGGVACVKHWGWLGLVLWCGAMLIGAGGALCIRELL